MPKLLFLINPHAGRGEAILHAVDCIYIMEKAGYEVSVHVTAAPRDAMLYTQRHAQQFDRIVCAGGDGTLGEVISGLMRGTRKPTLGYIPAGTTNDFAQSVGIPRDIEDAAKIAVSNQLRALDIGSFNDAYFNYIAAFGVFTEVSYATSQQSKNIFGRMAYILQGVKSLVSIKDYQMEISSAEETLSGSFIYGMVSNSVSVGGFKGLSPGDVALDDGLHEVLLVRPVENPLDLQALINDLLTHKETSKRYVYFKTSALHIVAQCEVPWTLDGEFGGASYEASIRNHSCAITFAVGKIQQLEA